MLSESTTTTGDSLPVMHINAFHIISADVTIRPYQNNRKDHQFSAEQITKKKQTEISNSYQVMPVELYNDIGSEDYHIVFKCQNPRVQDQNSEQLINQF